MANGTKKLIDDEGNSTFINTKYNVNYTVKKGQLTQNEILTSDLSNTLLDWKNNKDLILYKGDISDLKPSMRISYITKDLKVRIGGWIRAINIDEGYIALTGKGRSSWSVQIKDISGNPPVGIYIKTDTFELYEKRQAEKIRKQMIKDGLIKRTRTSKNTPQLLEAYDKLLNYYYYEMGYKKSRDYLYKFIVNDLKEKDEKGELNDFLQIHIDNGARFKKIPRKYVEEFLNKQAIHQLTKKREKVKDYQSFTTKEPNAIIQIDLLKVDNALLFNAIDIFTRRAYSLIISNKQAETIVDAVNKMIEYLGKPKALMCDNGSEFKNTTMEKYLKEEEITQIFATEYTPTTQGYIERFNGTIKQDINKEELTGDFISQERLNDLVDNYNKTTHSKIGMTPNEAMKPENIDKVRKNNRKDTPLEIQQRRDDIKLGDTVRIQILRDENKIQESNIKWTEELFKIVRIMRPRKNPSNPIVYKIKDANGEVIKGIFKRVELQLIKAVENMDKIRVVYEVEKFLKYRRRQGVEELLVKWKNYPQSEATWKAVSELRDEGFNTEVDDVLNKLKKRNSQMKKHATKKILKK